MRDWPPSFITTDKLRSYPEAIERLKREGKLSTSTRHRTSKYLNNIIEADHGALKQVIHPTRGFQTMKSAHRNHQRLRDHAHDPTWSLPHLQTWSKERSTLRQLTLRHRSITSKPNAEPDRACQELMQQSHIFCSSLLLLAACSRRTEGVDWASTYKRVEREVF